jgi:hypothetical protein
MSQRDICERLADVVGFVRFETGDRVAAAASLPEEARETILSLRAKVDALEARVVQLLGEQKGNQ